MPLRRHSNTLEDLYQRFDRRELVCPDPLQFLYEYEDPADREVVGLIASALAYGRVAQILRSVARVLETLGPHPAERLRETGEEETRASLAGFKHRFTTGGEMAALLAAIRKILHRRGSLEKSFLAGLKLEDETVLPALSAFVGEISSAAGRSFDFLLPDPRRGSACKRLNLCLRWMVRRDAIDPGRWGVPARMLVVPLDTHMHRFGREMSLTRRKAADARAALEMTAAFRRVAPEDPVKYDFALTRLGMTGESPFVHRRPPQGVPCLNTRCITFRKTWLASHRTSGRC
jgi:uncharacterized protein (TIGR02757 family)